MGTMFSSNIPQWDNSFLNGDYTRGRIYTIYRIGTMWKSNSKGIPFHRKRSNGIGYSCVVGIEEVWTGEVGYVGLSFRLSKNNQSIN
jgi:hypothetical protein